MSARKADGLIIGGGPAGATLSRLLADRGHEVISFDERLGVADEVAAIGVRKRAPTLPSPMPASITRHSNFATRWGHPDHAFEVRRAKFDALLFRHAQRSSVDARHRSIVRSVQPAPGGRSRVVVGTEGSECEEWDAGFVIDASGRDTVLATQNGWKANNRRHASAALFAHFKGVRRRDGNEQGNISIVSFEHGWVRMISAERAVAVVEAWFSGDAGRYRAAARRYSPHIDRGIEAFSWFIYRFTTPAMQYLFNNPRDLLGVSRGVTSMLAGDVFGNRAARRRLWLFKCLYAGASLVHWRETRAQARARQGAGPAAIGEGRLDG